MAPGKKVLFTVLGAPQIGQFFSLAIIRALYMIFCSYHSMSGHGFLFLFSFSR